MILVDWWYQFEASFTIALAICQTKLHRVDLILYLGRHLEKADSVMKGRAEGLIKDLRDALSVDEEGWLKSVSAELQQVMTQIGQSAYSEPQRQTSATLTGGGGGVSAAPAVSGARSRAHRRSVSGSMPKSRATWLRGNRCSLSSPTASCLNSSG
jgi:hypothetical protein